MYIYQEIDERAHSEMDEGKVRYFSETRTPSLSPFKLECQSQGYFVGFEGRLVG